MKPFLIIGVLCLTGCGESEIDKPASEMELSQRSLAGTWIEDSQLQHFRVLGKRVVDGDGQYILHLTNIFPYGVRTAQIAGMLQIEDDQLVDTITNDFSGNTRVPRIASVMKILRLDRHELVLSDTNSHSMVSFKRAEP
jgi:hypothetical protein